ncbi:MAG TPA: DUF1772 domain-containing protein [Bacteroidia bacterium]|nr:DUF1772 domain-containing protein [Bacteroidia bacterium]
MTQARQFFLYLTVVTWGIIIGGVVYSHIVYFPPFLSHLPESTSMLKGDYGIHEENFWMFIHPVAILSTLAALMLNWKVTARRKFILTPTVIYALAILATATYFVPELIAFSESSDSTTVTAAEWLERGQTWQYLSWIRGSFMFAGFISLLIALTKANVIGQAQLKTKYEPERARREQPVS